jgi:hypothetical protein
MKQWTGFSGELVERDELYTVTELQKIVLLGSTAWARKWLQVTQIGLKIYSHLNLY